MIQTTNGSESSIAVFIDFENFALGFERSRKKFDIQKVLERLLEKGKIIVKRAYSDWTRYRDYKQVLHEASVELIEVPKRSTAGKNSADIRMCVDAIDMAHSKAHIDTFVGMGFSNLIAFFMIVATAATLHAHGITDIQTTAQAAEALKPIAGNLAFLLFGLGIVGTGLLALPVLAGSAAYAVATVFKVRKGLNLPPAIGKPFYGILAAAMLVGVAIGIAHFNPIRALYWSAVINAVISVPVMVAVMLAASSARLMWTFVLPRRWKVLGWAATVAMAAASVAMFATMAA